VVELYASSRASIRPADYAVEWTRGEHTGEGPATLIATIDGIHIPAGLLSPDRATKWRSAGPAISLEIR